VSVAARQAATWVRALSLDSLRAQGRALLRHEDRQIALFAVADGVLACSNRCPHEGYPLSEGTLGEGCVLTCNWHNWKFDLRSGENLYGGDRLRVYPAEVRDGVVWVDVSDPPPAQQRAAALARLREAFDGHDYARLARELGRLAEAGADPLEAVRAAVGWSADRLAHGWSHAYAASADWLALRAELGAARDGRERADRVEAQASCLLESVGHMAWDVLRERRYPFPTERSAWDEACFLDAVEREDEAAALARVRGALGAGAGFADLEGALTRAALAHYADFGHSLIYVAKAGELIGRLGDAVAEPLLLALVRSLVYAYREERIPEFRGYHEALARLRRGGAPWVPRVDDYRGLGIDGALALTADAAGAPAAALHGVLLGANAGNMLGFELRWQERGDRPVADNVGWLDFSHGITFASAVRRQCARFPDTWPAGLLQMACFAGRNARYTGTRDLARWEVRDPDRFLAECVETLLDHGCAEYIVSAHLLKTFMATREEWRAARSRQTATYLLAALNRFLHSPLKRKHVRRTVRQALAFVAKGD